MDCQSNEWELVPKNPAMPDFDVVIVNSGFTKALIGTDYNNRVGGRVQDCRLAFGGSGPGKDDAVQGHKVAGNFAPRVAVEQRRASGSLITKN